MGIFSNGRDDQPSWQQPYSQGRSQGNAFHGSGPFDRNPSGPPGGQKKQIWSNPVLWVLLLLPIVGAITAGAFFLVNNETTTTEEPTDDTTDAPIQYDGVNYLVDSTLYESEDAMLGNPIWCVDISVENTTDSPVTFVRLDFAMTAPDGNPTQWAAFGPDNNIAYESIPAGESLTGALCISSPDAPGPAPAGDYRLEFRPVLGETLAYWTITH